MQRFAILFVMVAVISAGAPIHADPATAVVQTQPTVVVSGVGQVDHTSLAYVKDARAGLPMLTQPDHDVRTWQPVLVQPNVPQRYPEEIEERLLPSPDPEPTGLAWDGTGLWVSGRKTGRLYQVDPQSGDVLTSMAAPGSDPAGLACDGRTLWHIDAKTRTLYAIEAGKVTKQFTLDWPCAGVVVTPVGLIVSDSEKPVLRVVSTDTGQVTETLTAPDVGIAGLAYDGAYVWCGRSGYLIVHDLKHQRVVGGFAVAGRAPDERGVAGVAIVKDRLYYTDTAGGRLVSIAKPQHGQHLAARGTEYAAVFAMTVRNTSDREWPPGAFLMNVPIYEMPGQRLIRYEITPSPVAHYCDPDGNLHALISWPKVAPGEAFEVVARATLWSADRWTFVDPQQASSDLPEPLARICADGQRGRYPLGDDRVREFVQNAVGAERNPYWQFRLVHDAFVNYVTYAEPPDGSVVGVLKSRTGVCRHFSDALVTFGRSLGVPMLDAWAPHHNICCVWVRGAGWVFVEPTLDNAGKAANQWGACRWCAGLPRNELTTGVAGPSLFGSLLVDGKAFVPEWHCRIPKDLRGFWHQADWQTKAASDRRNLPPYFPAALQARNQDGQIRLNWQAAVDLERDRIEYAIEAQAEGGDYQEIGPTGQQQFEFKPEGKIVAVRVAAIDGHRDPASAPKAQATVR